MPVQAFGVPAHMVLAEAGDEEVAVVIARLHAEHRRLLGCARHDILDERPAGNDGERRFGLLRA